MLRIVLLSVIYSVGWVSFFYVVKKRNPTRICYKIK